MHKNNILYLVILHIDILVSVYYNKKKGQAHRTKEGIYGIDDIQKLLG